MGESSEPAQPGVPQDAQTLDEVMIELETDGYGQQLVPREGGMVRIPSGDEVPAGDLKVKLVRRLEGASDPDDMVFVAGVEIPGGERGVLVLGYGPNASGADADVLVALNLPDH